MNIASLICSAQSRIQVLSAFLVWTTVSMALVPSGAAKEIDSRPSTAFSVKTAMSGGDITVKTGGEIRVDLSKNLVDPEGDTYRVSLAFTSRDDFERARPELDLIDFDELDNWLFRPATGRAQALKRGESKSAVSFWQILAKAESAICGDTILRAFTTLPSGIAMGVNLHAAPSRIKPHKVTIAKNTLPGDCNYDVFDDCDTFAIGGCGGPDCVWSCRFMGITSTFEGNCIEEEIFGFNTCTCF